ncbi:MAG: hypothetical protein WD423_16690 [Rhodothermales bacterium]
MKASKFARIISRYTTVVVDDDLPSHCLGDWFWLCDDAEAADIEEDAWEQLYKIFQDSYNRYVRALPDDYESLLQLRKRLRIHLDAVAEEIDDAYALTSTEATQTRKSRLHELRRLRDHIARLRDKLGENARMGEAMPDCVETRSLLGLPPEAGSDYNRDYIIPGKAGFDSLYVPLFADATIGDALRSIDARISEEESSAHALARTFGWIARSVRSLEKILFEFEVYGQIKEMSLDDAKDVVDEDRGRPATMREDDFRAAVLHLLSTKRKCWHRNGERKGLPNRSAIYNHLEQLMWKKSSKALLKADGEPITYQHANSKIREFAAELGADGLKQLRKDAGISD